MRNPANWNVYTATAQPTPVFGRGYTGHEQLNQFGIINMNARLYDPLLARFLAPDPFVNAGMTNDFNRYIYARNNPMMYTDPSGKFFWIPFFIGAAIYTAITYAKAARDQHTWTPKINAIGIGYSNVNGAYAGISFDNGNHFTNIGWNNGLTVGSTQYGVTQMGPLSQKPVDPMQQVVQREKEMRQEDFENKNLNSSWTETLNNWNGGIGVLAGGVENLSGRLTIGVQNLKPYSSGWGGNQYIETLKVTEIGRFVGWGTLGFGTAIDLYGVNTYYTNGANDPNAVHPAKASLNLGVGMWSLLNPATAIGGAFYYGIGTFYPGGWQGAAEMNDKLLRQNQELLGKNWNLYRDF